MIFRPATLSDSPFVAWVVITAMGFDHPKDEFLKKVTELCQMENVLYSWKNTILAEKNGTVIGGLISYDGARYSTMREVTFPLIKKFSGVDYRDMELETFPGEWYLDSMAVLPEYRKQGVATMLIKEGIKQACEQKVPRAGMVVSPENPAAQRLYESLGFQYKKDMFIFGKDYRKMSKSLSEHKDESDSGFEV